MNRIFTRKVFGYMSLKHLMEDPRKKDTTFTEITWTSDFDLTEDMKYVFVSELLFTFVLY